MTQTANSPARQKQIWTLAFAAPAAAIGVHIYLLVSHYQLKYGGRTEAAFCDINQTFSCSAASSSAWSEFLGVPLAMWGAVANFALILLLALFRWLPNDDDNMTQSERLQLRALAGLVAGASLVMGTYSALSLGSLCPFCAVAYALSGVSFFAVWKLTGGPVRVKPTSGFIATAVFGFVFAFFMNSQIKESMVGKDYDKFLNSVVSDWKASPAKSIENLKPLVMGASVETAKVTLVEFADFRCIHCKNAAEPIKKFVEARKDVRFEFYAWPLDGDCNPAISMKSGASCLLAQIVWCAENKFQKGWAAHEAVFNRFEKWRSIEAINSLIPELATAIDAPAEDLKTCATSDEAKAAIRAHAELGAKLEIQATPAGFINGKQLPVAPQGNVLDAIYRSI